MFAVSVMFVCCHKARLILIDALDHLFRSSLCQSLEIISDQVLNSCSLLGAGGAIILPETGVVPLPAMPIFLGYRPVAMPWLSSLSTAIYHWYIILSETVVVSLLAISDQVLNFCSLLGVDTA